MHCLMYTRTNEDCLLYAKNILTVKILFKTLEETYTLKLAFSPTEKLETYLLNLLLSLHLTIAILKYMIFLPSNVFLVYSVTEQLEI